MSAGDFQRATKDLAERCLAKFDDAGASTDLRDFSLSIMISQISNGNKAMLAYVPQICQRLGDPAVLKQPAAVGTSEDFHCQMINAVSVIFGSQQENLARVWFGPVVQYLVELVACEDVETASLACEFWSQYCDKPMSVAAVREPWLAAFKPHLPNLIASLMDQMILREDAEVSSFDTLRQRAAAAFECVARVCPSELVCSAFGPLMEKRIKSNSWSEKEAAIRALRSFTRTTGQ